MRPLRIALCYDLKGDYLVAGYSPDEVLELDEQDTVDELAGALGRLGHEVVAVGRGVELARRLAGGERWDLVFNIAEGIRGRCREAQVPALCEMFDQPYTFSDPLTCALTLDKPLAKRLVRDAGLPTPDFAVVDSADQAAGVTLEPPLFAKPAAEGSSKGVTARSHVARREDLPAVCAELLEAYRQPVLVERYLPGREVTVGILGNDSETRVAGIMEVMIVGGDLTAYTAGNKEDWQERMRYRLLHEEDGVPLTARAREVALAVYRTLGCRDAARVDLRCDERGEPCFLEVNPLPGLHPIRSDLPILWRLGGHAYPDLLGQIVEAAVERWRRWRPWRH
jgi:D-alanine-D-alanine ligase